MALVFKVGGPEDVFNADYGAGVRAELEAHFGDAMDLSPSADPWYSEELGWSGWADLQDRSLEAFGDKATPHLLSMEAWNGVYVPVETDPCRFEEVPGDATPLDIASLFALIGELESLGEALELPIDEPGLYALAQKYLDDDELCDEDMDLQTYAQLLLGARIALERNQPLWVVK